MTTSAEFEAPTQKVSGHPKGLYVLFGSEMWERFSYYGMRALLTLYLVKHLSYSEANAKLVYATYTGLVYFTPLIGGFLADRVLGQRKAILVGGIVMAIGHFAMAFESLLYFALSLIIIGNGFFKPNISTMVGNLYPQGDPRRDGAYTIFYMGINLGAFVAPLACGALGENPNFGWHYGFGLAGVGMILGLISFLSFQNLLVGGFMPDREKAGTARLMSIDWAHVILTSACCVGLAYGASLAWPILQPYSRWMVPGFIVFFGLGIIFVFLRLLLTKGTPENEGWQRVSVIMIVSVFSIVFWMAFEQAGGTLTLFADQKTERYLLGEPFPEVDLRLIPAAQDEKAIPTEGKNLVIVASTDRGPRIRIFDEAGKQVADRVADPDEPKLTVQAKKEIEDFKKALDKSWSVKDLSPVERHGILSRAISIGGYPGFPASFFQSINPFLIFSLAPLFSIFWLKLDQSRFRLTSTAKMGIGLLLLGIGCVIMSQADRLAISGGSVGPQWLAFVYLFFTLGEICMSPIGLSLVNKLAPEKMASLMMAVWFLCTAIANYLAGTLEEELKVYHINLWVFLIATSIIPGLLLLAVTGPLKKMGHGRI
jgi:proton-dependent oligopeptide transporter, POT family